MGASINACLAEASINACLAGAFATVPVTFASFFILKFAVFCSWKTSPNRQPYEVRLNMNVRLAVVVPCYSEEEVLPETNQRLLALLTRLQELQLISADSGVHYVDDGSKDGTWALIESLSAVDRRVHGIKLSCNRGHQNALLAGLLTVEGDAVVSIDADLQDDVSVIEGMVREFINGAEVVYGVRDSRQTDTAFKRRTALLYYGLMTKMGVDLVHNHADFRLLGRRAVEALRQYGEVNMFLRGIVPLIGYRAATVRYDRAERFAGVSKYPLRKMLTFAIEGCHLVQHRALAADHAPRLSGFRLQLRDDPVHHLRHAGPERGHSGLGVIGGTDLLSRRHTVAFNRNPRRVCRQDLP
jgi:hypothetical protein